MPEASDCRLRVRSNSLKIPRVESFEPQFEYACFNFYYLHKKRTLHVELHHDFRNIMSHKVLEIIFYFAHFIKPLDLSARRSKVVMFL